ncbi:serine/threonine/tyrosine-interacting-like protein 1 isoform X1 [Arvicanthis niloticus]|uniref:serine/threonine/tyrosine-interacting-like protein 1 isoform X1 n=1 Tax=Arvicanthis niloticus TaxID=61156 RepID=UPI00402B0AE4
MADLLFCEPTELYNILNQVSKLSRLAEPNYLCLLDVRSKRQYDESHVITALRVKKRDHQYLIPESVDLECVRYCIVYDSNTSSLELSIRRRQYGEEEEEEEEEEEKDKDKEEDTELLPGPAVEFGQILIHFTRQPVYVLRGGYECFSGMYHFFRTQKIIWMPQELDAFQPYPIEILPGKVFLGKISQACNAKMHKDLKIKAHVNISMETTPYFVGNPDKLLHIKIEDTPDSILFPFFRHICHFMEVLGPCKEMQNQHAAQSGLRGPAAGVGESPPWGVSHRHLGAYLLTIACHPAVITEEPWLGLLGWEGGWVCTWSGPGEDVCCLEVHIRIERLVLLVLCSPILRIKPRAAVLSLPNAATL